MKKFLYILPALLFADIHTFAGPVEDLEEKLMKYPRSLLMVKREIPDKSTYAEKKGINWSTFQFKDQDQAEEAQVLHDALITYFDLKVLDLLNDQKEFLQKGRDSNDPEYQRVQEAFEVACNYRNEIRDSYLQEKNDQKSAQ